jgi:hypothetical protein
VLELAGIVRDAGPAYLRQFGSRMLPSHRRALRDIGACRTAAMGGHVEQCDHCSRRECVYHSCRNRHCPKCHGNETRQWLSRQLERLPRCRYYFVTFTLPSELRALARAHQKTVYSLLMRCAADALLKLAADPQHLGAKPGLLGVLHTWSRALLYHPHAHFLVTAGGLSSDGERWLEPKNPRFLVPGYALAVVFRAKLRDALASENLIELVDARVWKKKWVVQCQRAGGGKEVLAYLARYIHRVALTNESIERFKDDRVTFRYIDSKTKQTHSCNLLAQDFLSRFLQHVLPRGFKKTRYYGLLSSAAGSKLDTAQRILRSRVGLTRREHCPASSPQHDQAGETDLPTKSCPECRLGQLRIVARFARLRGPP